MVSNATASASSGTGSTSSSSASTSYASYPILPPDPPLSGKEVDAMNEYASSLEDLFVNSKPLINMLTMLAEENRASARAIVLAIELHLRKVPSEVKLPVLYLIDSIIKNVGSPYNTLFNQNIVPMFCSVFEKGDERTRMQLFKLRQTWNQMLPISKLYALDVHVHGFDPAWPVQPLATMIHVNPKFLPPHVQGAGSTTASPTPTTGTPAMATVAAPLAASAATTTTSYDDTKSTSADAAAASLRENLRRKQKKLLELRQKKLELELLQTKEKLREQEMLQQQQQQLMQQQQLVQQQQLIQQQLTAAAATSNVDKKSRRTSSKHSSSSGSSSSKPSISSELENKRTKLSQLLKQELAQAKLVAPVTLNTPTAPATVPLTPSTNTTVHSSTTATTAKVTPPTSIEPSHHTTTTTSSPASTEMTTSTTITKTQQLPITVPAAATGMPATAVVATAAPVMRIAPVSSQLLSAVQKRGAIRDPRLLRAQAQATADSAAAKPVVTSLSSSSKTTSTSSKSSSSSSSTSVTSSSAAKSTSATSSSKNSVKSNSAAAKSVTSSPSKSSSSSSVVTSSPSKSTSKSSSSVTSLRAGGGVVTSSKSTNESGDELLVTSSSKKTRTSGGGGSSASSQSQSSSNPPVTAVSSDSVATTADVVVKTSSRSKSSSSSRSSSAESAVASSKHHRDHHSKRHHHQERAKMIDTVTEKDSLDLDRKEEEEEPAAVDHQSQELDTPPAPAEPRIGQLSPPEAPPPPTSGGKRLSEERDVSPPTKKSKVMDRFDELFGGEKEEEEKEVVMPPAPPPPSMTAAELKSSPSLTTDQMASLAENDGTRASGGGRWSKYKAVRQTSLSEPYPAAAARTKNKDKDNKDTDRLGRPLLYRHGKDRRNSLRAKSGGGAVLEHLAVQDEYDSGGASEGGSVEGGNSPARLLEGGQVGGGCSYILQQAESQFKNGSLSSTQYNQILKEMIELNELKKLDEARRKEEREHRRSRRKYRHHQKVEDQSEDAVQPAQPISEQNNEPAASAGENTSKVIEDEVRSMFDFDMHDSDSDTLSDYEDLEESIEPRKEDTVNGDDKTVNDMDISPDEDSLSIKSGKESEEKVRTDDKDEEDSKIVYEPLQPPPMPPAFVSRRSSEEEEVGVKQEVKEENEDVGGKDVDLRQNEELVKVEGGVDVKKEPVLPTKQDVDNRLGFPPGIGLAALSPPHDSSGMVVKVPAVIDSTKDIDWRRPLVIPPPPNPPTATIPMETDVVESANSAPAPSSRNPAPRLAPPPPEAKGGGRILPGAWGGPQGGGGAPWMMQAPLPCWGGPGGPMAPPGMHPSNVMPLRPPPIPPQVMFEPDSNVRLCRPPGPLPPPPLPPPTTPQQLVAGGPGGPGPPAGAVDLPPADLGVLESIADDTMKSIEIDGTPRDIRYYGNTAVVFLSWDDPREILFQSSAPRKLIIDDRQVVTLPFNAPYKEVVIDGHTYPVQIGGPTRELYVGNQFYQVLFGGPPISVALGASDRLHKLQLEGPPPPVRIGRPRRDMCLGKITLIVDARHHYTIYLDPKAQRFDLDGVPHIIRFVEALETTVINGVPFKFEFGGLPRPVYSRGKKHYVRLTSLPHGVVPGYVDILGMEGGRRGEPPLSRRPLPPPPGGVVRPPLPPHLLLDDNSQGSVGHRTPPNGGEDSPRQDFLHDDRSMSMMDSEAAMMEAPPPSIDHQNRKHHSPVKTNPLDVLSTLLAPAATAPVSGFSYSLEKDSTSSSSYQPALSTDQHANKPKPPSSSSNPSSGENLLGDLSLQELFEKLVATGIVPTGAKNAVTSSASTANQEKGGGGGGGDQSESMDDNSHIDMSQTSDKIEFVDFGKPQTLRVRQPGLIQQLYTGIQCSSCGVRFAPEQTIKYSQHLDWHFRQNRRERDSARMVHSRTWYYDLSDWTQFEEIEDIEERALSWFDTQTLGDGEGGEGGYADDSRDEAGDDVPSAACESGAVDVRCALCRDRFDIFYNEDKEEWHVRRALKQDNDYYHPLCWDDHLASMKTPPPEPEEVEKQEPITSITIDEDDSEEGGGGGNKVEKKEGEDGVKKEEEEEEEEDDDDDVIIQEPEHKMEIIELLKDDDEEEEEEEERRRRNRMKEEEEGDESCSKLSSDKKDSEDGDSLKPPTDFHSILRNIKKEKIDVDALDGDSGAEEEVIDLDASTRRGGDGEGEGDDDEQPLINRPPPVVDTTQVKVACSIDGNVELDDSGSANMLAAPSKIKINISKVTAAVAPPQPSADQSAVSSPEPPPPAVDEVELAVERMVVEAPPPPVVFRAPPPATASMVVPLVALVESSQPPPPGEEPVPLTLKPRLFGNKLNELPPVSRGTELSGLCSIM